MKIKNGDETVFINIDHVRSVTLSDKRDSDFGYIQWTDGKSSGFRKEECMKVANLLAMKTTPRFVYPPESKPIHLVE